ncbi:MAG: type III-B CRISPR module RAMP protein Cmr4 [Fimbriimonadales bacterium]|nr:type III-B CRISPR module RAMP protein Cmr4 [Fimbriimonadales bacterium]
MMKETKLIFLHALTPLHVGTGQAVANVDLPIAREKATGFPIVPASAFKGVLRDHFTTFNEKGEPQEPGWVQQAFGTQEAAGDWMFTDLRILCLPVRSFYGVFAYVTCPLILQRLQRAAHAMGISSITDLDIQIGALEVAVPQETELQHRHKVYLEDIDLNCNLGQKEQAGRIGRTLADILFEESDRPMFLKRFAIVSNETFNFLSETGTEVAARVRLEDTVKTVAQGGLWYEEAVPAEAIFYGFLSQTRGSVPLSQIAPSALLQIGGDATIGRGLCKVVTYP